MSAIAGIKSDALTALKEASPQSHPDRSSEQWRKVRLDGVDVLSRSPGKTETRIYFSNSPGSPLSEYKELPAPSPENQETYRNAGIELLSDSFQDRWAWLKERSERQRDPFELTCLAYSEPLALQIKKDVVLRIVHTGTEGDLHLPALFVRVDPDKELDLFIEYIDSTGNSEDPGRMWSSSSFVEVGDNARVRIVDSRKHDDLGFHFHRMDVLEGRDSNVHYCAIHRGGLTGKGFVRARALTKGGTFRGIGLYTGRGAQFHDMEMEISHEADHCDSTLLYKTVLRDRAHSVFNGSLVAPPHIKQINSHQTNNNIVLSKKARAESMPRLIIQSEDVSCEHGATVGDLDDQALFFLQCRGVPLEQARRMLIEGFMEEILSELRLSEEDLAGIREEMFPILES